MICTLENDDLSRFVKGQLNNFFPDNRLIDAIDRRLMRAVLERTSFCFRHIAHNEYFNGQNTKFNHLYSDQYLIFLYFLSNQAFVMGYKDLATKAYYLNKALHGFDCFFENTLPDIFFVAHGVGTVLGKARYSNYFYVSAGCLVGAAGNNYPIIEEMVGLGARSSVIGASRLMKNCSVGAGTLVYNTDVPENARVVRNSSGSIEFAIQKNCSLAESIFNL